MALKKKYDSSRGVQDSFEQAIAKVIKAGGMPKLNYGCRWVLCTSICVRKARESRR